VQKVGPFVFVYGQGDYPTVRQAQRCSSARPRSHPQFRNEWCTSPDGSRRRRRELGVQITFFRNRPRVAEDLASRFAPRQLLFAHAALAIRRRRALHDQRAARAGFGLAQSEEAAPRSRSRTGGSGSRERLRGGVTARDFPLQPRFDAKQAVLLQGERGFSRKGPNPAQASYYYSLPHLAVTGSVVIGGRLLEVSGEAWLDHEWSSQALAKKRSAGTGSGSSCRRRCADGFEAAQRAGRAELSAKRDGLVRTPKPSGTAVGKIDPDPVQPTASSARAWLDTRDRARLRPRPPAGVRQ